jgi:hypothetical protein
MTTTQNGGMINQDAKTLKSDAAASTPKVTLAFRCSADLKLRLSKAASSRGFTTSEFCESLLENFGNIERKYSTGKNDEPAILKNQVEELTRKLNAYECPELQKLFKENECQVCSFTSDEGQEKKLEITSVYDVFVVLVNSFKTERL